MEKVTGAPTSSARIADDLTLALDCAAGDRRAQRELFRAYRGNVHATLYRILGSNRDIEDLIQDTFLQVFRSLERYRGEARLVSWISRITTRVAFAYIAQRKPASAALESVPDPPSNDPSAESQVAARDAARRLYAVLDRIDPKHRVPFALHVIMGMPLRDVADATDSTLVATKSRVWRARREVNRRAKRDPLLADFLAKPNQLGGDV
jgi:RNA polymerase sigma-70 factor (ECF subfamily)